MTGVGLRPSPARAPREFVRERFPAAPNAPGVAFAWPATMCTPFAVIRVPPEIFAVLLALGASTWLLMGLVRLVRALLGFPIQNRRRLRLPLRDMGLELRHRLRSEAAWRGQDAGSTGIVFQKRPRRILAWIAVVLAILLLGAELVMIDICYSGSRPLTEKLVDIVTVHFSDPEHLVAWAPGTLLAVVLLALAVRSLVRFSPTGVWPLLAIDDRMLVRVDDRGYYLRPLATLLQVSQTKADAYGQCTFHLVFPAEGWPLGTELEVLAADETFGPALVVAANRAKAGARLPACGPAPTSPTTDGVDDARRYPAAG